MTAGSTVLTFRLKNIRLCQSALVVRLRDIRLDPPSRGHPSGSSVWTLRLDPPSGPSDPGTSVSILRLGALKSGPRKILLLLIAFI